MTRETRGRPCPRCRKREPQHHTEVLRVEHLDDYTRRQHHCLLCDHKWFTRQYDEDSATGSSRLSAS
jgi:hypothetical protein